MVLETFQRIRLEIPNHVKIICAVKNRSVAEVREAISSGVINLGQNYVQEAENIYSELKKDTKKVQWHMIGHLQKNKINRILKIFNMVQTIDSLKIAEALNQRTKKVLPILIEINSGEEKNKFGVNLNQAEKLIRDISVLKNLKIEGLMTMGTKGYEANCFKKTKKLFNEIKNLKIPNVEMKTLSMGMSDSYKIAIKNGSNMIRLGTIIFGKRKSNQNI